MRCGSADDPADVELARERLHPATMAAEGPLHELGGISIINSDSQGMGRIGETVRRTWQLAHAMKAWRSGAAGQGWPGAPAVRRTSRRPAESLTDDGLGSDDNERVLSYLAKYTIDPAITHGVSADVGTLAPGRLADIVLWRAEYFGVRPELILKGGHLAWGPLGEGNASVENAEPRRYSAHWGGHGLTPPHYRSPSSRRPPSAPGSPGNSAAAATSPLCPGRARCAVRTSSRGGPEVDPADGTVSPDGRVLTARPISQVPLPLPARLSSRCHRYDRRMPRSGLGHHLRSRARG